MVQEIVDNLATAAARLEESAYRHAVILPNFPLTIQLDYYSSGAKSVYTILRYYSKRCTLNSVERALKAAENGTSVADIKRVLRERRLSYREVHSARLVDLKKAIVSNIARPRRIRKKHPDHSWRSAGTQRQAHLPHTAAVIRQHERVDAHHWARIFGGGNKGACLSRHIREDAGRIQRGIDRNL